MFYDISTWPTDFFTISLCTLSSEKKQSRAVFILGMTDFQNFCTDGLRRQLATKLSSKFPPHLKYVATILWNVICEKCTNRCQYYNMHITCALLAVDIWRCVQVAAELHHSWWHWTSAWSVLLNKCCNYWFVFLFDWC